MKKTIFNLFTGVIFTSLFSNYATAQNTTDVSYSASKKANAVYITPEEKAELNAFNTTTEDPVRKADLKAMKANLKAAKANFKATNDFNKKFKNASGVKWYNENNMIAVSFKRDDLYSKVVYNKKGNFLYSIINCYESDLPDVIRSMIKSEYPNYNILLAKEITKSGITVHMVHIEDKYNLKEIIAHDGELTVYQEFKKSR